MRLCSLLSTGWPDIHGFVFLVPCKTWLVQCTLINISVHTSVTFFKVPEHHGHVYLVGWYLSLGGEGDVVINELPPGDQQDGHGVVVEPLVLAQPVHIILSDIYVFTYKLCQKNPPYFSQKSAKSSRDFKIFCLCSWIKTVIYRNFISYSIKLNNLLYANCFVFLLKELKT